VFALALTFKATAWPFALFIALYLIRREPKSG